MMKKLVLVIMFLASLNLWGQESKFSIGINSGIGTEPDNSTVWGIVARYNITNVFRVAPEFNISFREVEFVTHQEKWTNCAGNIDLNYLFSYKNVSIYPIVGISFTNGKDKIRSLSNNSPSHTSMNVLRLGGNVGAGIEYTFLKNLYINAEAKYYILHRIWNQQFMTTDGSEKNLGDFKLLIGAGYKF